MPNETPFEGTPSFVSRSATPVTKDYREWLTSLRQRYRQSQIKAATAVNGEMLRFYWTLGRDILTMNAEARWGTGFMKRLSLDLQHEFPNSTGLSFSNLKNARKWYSFYYERFTIGQQVVGQLEMPENFARVPWGHHIAIMSKSKDLKTALFYIRKTVEEGMSRSTLLHCIESNRYEREGKASSNFREVLPPVQGDLASDMLKSPYNFDFLQMREQYNERDFEESLSRHITDFLLELGQGFAFVGRQMELAMPSGKTYRPDMIFYHIRLKCYVVVELKVVDFEPEFAGKLNFYVSAVDELLKGEGDNPTIGLLICKRKDDVTVEWALRGVCRPLGVAEYDNEIQRIARSLPAADIIKNSLMNDRD